MAEPRYRERLLSSIEIYRHLFTVMLPAMGSTGGTILFLLQELAAMPDFQHRLREELAQTDLVADPRPPPLTAMTIREGLRLYPQAAAITRRLGQAEIYGGYYIPKGSHTFVQLHTLHRNPASYAEPDRFDPLRFARPGAAGGGKWAGFSLGPMACSGRAFAELQIATALQELLGRHILRRTDDRSIRHNNYQGSVTLQPEPRELELETLE